MNLKRRLEELEERRRKAEEGPHTLPPEVDLVLTLHKRAENLWHGKPVPPFTAAQLEEFYRQDLELTGPTTEKWRTTPGWTDEESQQMLDEWEEAALARLKEIDEGASYASVYEEHDLEEDTLDD
jgi:hypothetical protein